MLAASGLATPPPCPLPVHGSQIRRSREGGAGVG